MMRFILSCLVSFTLLGCSPPKDDVVIVGNSWLGAMPVYTLAAVDPELIPPGLKTVMLASDVSVMRMLGNEAVSGAFVTLDNALSVNTVTDGDYCIAMVLDRSMGADAVLVQNDWQPQAKEPITVGLEDSTIARYMLSRWLTLHDLNMTDVTTRILLPTQHLDAFSERKVDAIITYQPFIEKLRESGAKVIFDSSHPDVSVVDILILHKAAWPRAKSLVQQLKQSLWPQALAQLREREQEFWQGLIELTGSSAEELEKALEGVHFVTLPEQPSALERVLQQDMPATADYLVASGMHDAVVPLTECGAIE
ncbi:hypothetical protein J6I90_05135 [Pseudidiomarina sp. 1APP75-32.1]|uniref:SsuA/THI5-like domain-containing protein n=2 Tax=Pseudidiomarina terrestris TaxID=2820060 RepID=A0AAW7QXS0_9GAMM|nr:MULTISPECIES: ABC transporter substrate-binding protein [unclassified Pseudidiomarina]MDN7124257.1 hypothetical protein [Pseudidiomarina sp. 1APP75-32.1]MDN7126258.1 hypothetical protein [Pseudidiomarina sp. 1APR75-33.1]